MIEKIFIPTVNRVDAQITFKNLPDELKKKVVMVVQAWERPKYSYDCEYLVLPDTSEYHFSDTYCIARTRKLIYEAGQNMKYALLDDDIEFVRRNAKYFGDSSNMEKSKRKSTNSDIIEMFDLFDRWLDDPDVTVCGCSFVQFPPRKERYYNNSSMSSVYWINGNDFNQLLPKMDLTSVKVFEDVCFLLSLLVNGYGNRVSSEFVYNNISISKKNYTSTIWDSQTAEQTTKDHQYLEKLFPGIFQIKYDESGNRVQGGFRNVGKTQINWKKAYKFNLNEEQSSIEKYFEE
jgi:hypothetical protein